MSNSTTKSTSQDFILDMEGPQPQLKWISGQLSIELDFAKDAQVLLRGKNELIAKACGAAHGCKSVFDATGGLARDAFSLVRLGFHVEVYERHPLIYQFVHESWHQFAERERFPNFIYKFGDSREVLKDLMTASERPEVVYLDPMYPVKKKSALSRKDLQILQALLETQSEASAQTADETVELFELGLQVARNRVVVKRPPHAPHLGKRPTHSFEGKAVRFDFYSVL